MKLTARFNYKYGLRAGITILVAFLVVHLFNIEYGAWLQLTAGFILVGSVGQNIKRGVERIVGHAVGFVVVLLLYFIFWQYMPAPYFWVPALIFLTFLCFPFRYFLFSICMMSLIVYIYYSFYGNTFPNHQTIVVFAGWRLLDITVGTVIALLFTLLIFPNTTSLRMQKLLVAECQSLKSVFSKIMKCDFYESKVLLTDALMQQHLFKAQLQEAYYEQSFLRVKLRRMRLMMAEFYKIRQCLKRLEVIMASQPVDACIQPKIDKLTNYLLTKFDNVICHIEEQEPAASASLLDWDECYHPLFNARDNETMRFAAFTQAVAIISLLKELDGLLINR